MSQIAKSIRRLYKLGEGTERISFVLTFVTTLRIRDIRGYPPQLVGNAIN